MRAPFGVVVYSWLQVQQYFMYYAKHDHEGVLIPNLSQCITIHVNPGHWKVMNNTGYLKLFIGLIHCISRIAKDLG